MDIDKKQEVITCVNKVLGNLNFTKIKVSFPDADSTGGYAAEMVYVDVVAEQNGSEKTLHLIIKKAKDSKVVKDDFNFKEVYNNEINIYSKFVPYLQQFAKEKNTAIFDNIPYCYGTENEKQEFVIILENLKYRGFKVHDIKNPMNLNHAKLVLEAYAKWHAFWFALKDQRATIFEEFGKCNSFQEDNKIFDFLIGTIVKTLDDFIEIYEKKNRPDIIEKLKFFKENSKQLLTKSFFNKGEKYLVVRHGDCWNNNFLFHYDEGETDSDKVVIIDWQGGILGSPAADLNLFLFYCCSRKELEQMDDLLMFYYDIFSKKLIELGSDPDKCFPWKIFLASFKEYAPGAIMGMPLASKMPYQDESYKNFDIAQAFNDGNFDGMFNVGLRDPEGYFNKVNDILELCIERGLI